MGEQRVQRLTLLNVWHDLADRIKRTSDSHKKRKETKGMHTLSEEPKRSLLTNMNLDLDYIMVDMSPDTYKTHV